MKFTDEELSRIVSAHAGGQLARMGMLSRRHAKPCVLQAAKADDCLNWTEGNAKAFELANEFDGEYQSRWSSSRFLRWLESQGVA